MRKTLFLLLLFFIFTPPLWAQIEDPEKGLNPSELEQALIEAWNQGCYEDGLHYLELLQECDTLSFSALFYGADCYIFLKRYDDCLEFCDYWTATLLDEDKMWFNPKYGECYYFKGQDDLAAKYLQEYISECDSLDIQPSYFIVGICADALFWSAQYTLARQNYERYFATVFGMEGLNWESLQDSEDRIVFGYKLYNYAWCTFFSGNETSGKYFLELASNCGNEAASTDLTVLSRNASFATVEKIKWRLQEEFDEIIEEYDPGEGIGDLAITNTSKFWEVVKSNSEEYGKLTKAMSKERKPSTLQSALDDVNSGASVMNQYLAMCYPYERGETEDNLESKLFGDDSPLIDFRFYPAQDVNAFATPYGQIYITSGLAKRYHYNTALLLGVCAHEATHYECQHTLIAKWNQLKKEKTNAIVGGIVAGVSTAVMVGAGLYGASYGVTYDDSYWENSMKLGLYTLQAFDQDAFYFKFKYGRNQELESDIIAYRFLESCGIGGYAYIMALQMLGDDDYYMKADSTSDHPTTLYRVRLLKYLYSKDHPSE